MRENRMNFLQMGKTLEDTGAGVYWLETTWNWNFVVRLQKMPRIGAVAEDFLDADADAAAVVASAFHDYFLCYLKNSHNRIFSFYQNSLRTLDGSRGRDENYGQNFF